DRVVLARPAIILDAHRAQRGGARRQALALGSVAQRVGVVLGVAAILKIEGELIVARGDTRVVADGAASNARRVVIVGGGVAVRLGVGGVVVARIAVRDASARVVIARARAAHGHVDSRGAHAVVDGVDALAADDRVGAGRVRRALDELVVAVT